MNKFKNNWLKISIFALIFFLFLIVVIGPDDPVNTNNPEETEVTEEIQDSETKYEVVKVVDGDTVKLNINGDIKTIRLIGIDTPETVHPSKPVECFGMEASNKAKDKLSGEKVILEIDESQGMYDKYNRLLGYIILDDGTNFNKLMIEEGYAHEYTYSIPYKYQEEFKEAEKHARENNLGLWGEGVCTNQEETSSINEIPIKEKANDQSNEKEDNEVVNTSGSKWYVSSYHTSKYYYCEESNGWKSLSERYLEMYDSEEKLISNYPNHTLHHSCD